MIIKQMNTCFSSLEIREISEILVYKVESSTLLIIWFIYFFKIYLSTY